MFSEDFQRYYYLNKRRSWRRIHTGYDTNDGLQRNRWTSTLHSKDKTSSSLSLLNREGRWGTTDDFATSFLHFSLFSTALWDLPNSRPVHSLMMSSHLFLCLPCLFPPFTVPCKMVLARPNVRKVVCVCVILVQFRVQFSQKKKGWQCFTHTHTSSSLSSSIP